MDEVEVWQRGSSWHSATLRGPGGGQGVVPVRVGAGKQALGTVPLSSTLLPAPPLGSPSPFSFRANQGLTLLPLASPGPDPSPESSISVAAKGHPCAMTLTAAVLVCSLSRLLPRVAQQHAPPVCVDSARVTPHDASLLSAA